MKKYLAAILILSLVLGAATYFFVPLSSPTEICSTVTQWSNDDKDAARLNHPMGLAWRESILYVADTENGVVKKFRGDGSLVSEWKGFKRPVAVTTVGDVVYVADFLTDRISKLTSNGALIAQWGGYGKGEGEFDAPSGIAADSNGYVYVADFYNHRIQKFTGDGKFVVQWGGQGRWNGRFHYPTDVAVNSRGEIFVADAYNHRIQKFTQEGVYLAKWGGLGYGISGKWFGWFRLAKAVTVDSHNNVYVADAFNYRVQKFTDTGELLGVWGKSQPGEEQLVQYPAGVAVASDGTIYVSDFFKNRIWKVECH